jgi:hypothetical protein
MAVGYTSSHARTRFSAFFRRLLKNKL